MDYDAYNGTAPKRIRKRTGAELVAAATAKAARDMFGVSIVPVTPTEPAPPPVAEPPAPEPIEPAPVTLPEAKVEASKPAVGLRVRMLEPESSYFGRDGSIQLIGHTGRLIVRYDNGSDFTYRQHDWLKELFPLDGSVKPSVGMAVTFIDGMKKVHDAIIEEHDKADNTLLVRVSGFSPFWITSEEWLMKVWPAPGEVS